MNKDIVLPSGYPKIFAERGIDAVYDRYSYMPEKREALKKWAEFLQGLVDNKESKAVKLHG